MNKTATIQVSIDPKVKKNAQKILDKLNLSMSEAISIFLTQVSLNKGTPFAIKIPNELTEETLLKSEAGVELHSVKDKKNNIKKVIIWFGFDFYLLHYLRDSHFRKKSAHSELFRLNDFQL